MEHDLEEGGFNLKIQVRLTKVQHGRQMYNISEGVATKRKKTENGRRRCALFIVSYEK